MEMGGHANPLLRIYSSSERAGVGGRRKLG